MTGVQTCALPILIFLVFQPTHKRRTPLSSTIPGVHGAEPPRRGFRGQTPKQRKAGDSCCAFCKQESPAPRVGVADGCLNRADLLFWLRRVSETLSKCRLTAVVDRTGDTATRSRRLRDRFASDELDAMTERYWQGATAQQVADEHGVSLSSVKRLMRQQGVKRA